MMCSSLKLSRLVIDEMFTNEIAEQWDAPNGYLRHASSCLRFAPFGQESRHGLASVIAALGGEKNWSCAQGQSAG